MIKEEWKPIKGYEDLYMISNRGRVKSLEKTIEDGDSARVITRERIMKGSRAASYRSVHLYRNGAFDFFYIHRLVAEHFIKKPNNCDVVDHINQNRLDNRVENLQWVDYSQNAHLKYKKFKSNGYYYNKRDNNYVARITTYGVLIQLGRFKCEKEANECYKQAYKEWYGIDIA